MKRLIQKLNPFVSLIIILSFFLGWQLGHKDLQLKWANFSPSLSVEDKEPPKNIDLDFELFWDTWDLISKKHIDKENIDPQKLFYGAISGMVSALGDPYTYFLPPEQQKTSQEELNGAFEGVGIQLGFNKDKNLVVIAPLDGTPAKKGGIKPQDIIIKIEDKDTSGINLTDAVKLIRGPKGTKVTLTILSEGDQDSKEVTLIRETILVKSVEVEYKDTKNGQKIAWIKLTRFGERTDAEWNEAVSGIVSQNVKGVILDMRNNPGGFLEASVFISSEFLSSGVIVQQEDSGGQRISSSVNRKGKLTSTALVVLINKGSASASEIVGGALQDKGRAKLVGEKSFGKGTIQEPEKLPGGSGIHITVAKWLTPNGRWVNDTEGLEPDVIIASAKVDPESDLGEIPDPQLDKALEMLE